MGSGFLPASATAWIVEGSYGLFKKDVNAVAISPDGTCFAAGGFEKRVCVADISNGELIFEYIHRDRINGLAWSPDGNHLAATCEDGSLLLLTSSSSSGSRPTTPTIVHKHACGLWGCEFSPDGEQLAVGCSDGSLLILCATRACVMLQSIQEFTHTVLCVSFHQSGRLLAAGESYNGGIHIFSLSSEGLWERIAQLKYHNDAVHDVCFNTAGTLLVAASQDTSASLWQIPNCGQGPIPPLPCLVLADSLDAVWCCTFTADDQHVITGSWDGMLTIWDAVDGSVVTQLEADGLIASMSFHKKSGLVAVGLYGAKGIRIVRLPPAFLMASVALYVPRSARPRVILPRLEQELERISTEISESSEALAEADTKERAMQLVVSNLSAQLKDAKIALSAVQENPVTCALRLHASTLHDTRARISDAVARYRRTIEALDAAVGSSGIRFVDRDGLSLFLDDIGLRALQPPLDGVSGAELRVMSLSELEARRIPFPEAVRLQLHCFLAEHQLSEPPSFQVPANAGMLSWNAAQTSAWLVEQADPDFSHVASIGWDGPSLASAGLSKIRTATGHLVSRGAAVKICEAVRQKRRSFDSPDWAMRWTAIPPLADIPL